MATLTSLSVGSLTLEPEFSPDVTEYNAEQTVTSSTRVMVLGVRCTTYDSGASVVFSASGHGRMQYNSISGNSISASTEGNGKSTLIATVTGTNGARKTYNVHIHLIKSET